MKLALVLLTLTGWFAAAKALQRTASTTKWQTRCLGCGHTAPANNSHIIRHAETAKKQYSLAKCDNCEKRCGFAVEELQTS